MDSPAADSPKINSVPRNEFTDYFMNITLNAGLYMAVHRPRNVQNMRAYQEEHSYAVNSQDFNDMGDDSS